MIIDSLTKITAPPIFYQVKNFINGVDVHIKLEGLNISSSIKMKPAIWLIKKLEEKGSLVRNKSTVVCSSSGNLGIALSVVCKEKGYPLVCISDPNISSFSEKYINLYGGKIIKVTKKDENKGYLGTRLKLIKEMLDNNEEYVFVDQYANLDNIDAHFLTTASEIFSEFPKIGYLFLGAGTTGTLMGCAKFFKTYSPGTKIIAVDAVGSVTFGFPAAKRLIPGLGTSSAPSIVDASFIDEILLVEEVDTIKMCHNLLENYGLFLGGSSGSVLQGIKQYAKNIVQHAIVVTVSPDFGDKYTNTIYNNEWLQDKFPQIPPMELFNL